MRSEECCDSIDKAAELCNLKPKAVSQVKRAAGLYDVFKGRLDVITSKEQESPAIAEMEAAAAREVISSLPPDVINEIGREQNKPIVEEILKEVVSIGRNGKRPTKKVVRDIAAKYSPQPEIPTGLFDVILADPPWRYEFSETDSREVENQYPTMSLDRIKELKIPTAENAILFLWSPAPKLEEALQVISSWGFSYRTGAVWDKGQIGMGYWFRSQHEHLLLAVKGTPTTPPESVRYSSVIRSPREEHSKKPDVVYEMIEAMFPTAKKVELFARVMRMGWSSWGNQVEGI
jgi:N6-adenosine-specific RNA methylase IME4